MKIRIPAVLSILFTLAQASAAPGAPTSDATPKAIPIDGYAAQVNDRVILESDVRAMAAPLIAQHRIQLDERVRQGGLNIENMMQLKAEFEDLTDRIYREALEALIERNLVVEEFEASEAEIPERMIKDQMQARIHGLFGSDSNRLDRLVEALRAQNVTMEKWRDQLREGIIVSITRRQEMEGKINISPQAIRDRYDEQIEKHRIPAQVDLRVIAISAGLSEKDRQVKHEVAEAVRARIANGEDFAALAREYSDGRKKAEGGKWGWYDPQDLRTELAEVAAVIVPNQVSEVIEVNQGGDLYYYLLLVSARKLEDQIPFEQVRDAIREELYHEEEFRLYREWIERLRSRHYVKYYTAEPAGDGASETATSAP